MQLHIPSHDFPPLIPHCAFNNTASVTVTLLKLNGGDDYYSVYLQMGAVSLSSPAFKDEGGERYLVKDVLLGTGTPGLKSGFMYL